MSTNEPDAQLPEDVDKLKNQLKVARSEIKNLRHEIQSINQIYKKDVDEIRKSLHSLAFENLLPPQGSSNLPLGNNSQLSPGSNTALELGQNPPKQDQIEGETTSNLIQFKPIGVIRTIFNEKRALPRQAVLATNFLSRIELSPELYTNPSHSLESLEEFSHIWIIYHFHKNTMHAKAKVAPPRLDGKRIGVFSSRSPHRPNPIGLSLVELDHIEDRFIFFKGTDMVDGTPVLDIKPYIPHYDSPAFVDYHQHPNPGTPEATNLILSKRGAPDGEEETEEQGAAGGVLPSNTTKQNVFSAHSSPTVKVPNWIMEQTKLSVLFSDNAKKQMENLGVEPITLKEVLKSDPRSVYLRSRYGSDIYTFQLGDLTVTCKFEDDYQRVEVLQVRKKIDTEDLSNAE